MVLDGLISFHYAGIFLEMMIEGIPEVEQSLYLTMPFWVNAVFALEVFGGLTGSAALLLRKPWGTKLFTISIIGVVSQTLYVYFFSEAVSVMGAQAIIMPLVSILIGSGLIYFAKFCTAKNWLR